MKSSVANLFQRRHLLWVVTTSNLKRQNKNTVLGYLWWLLDPILMTAVYYVLVAVLFRRGGDNQPFVLFVLCGMLCWKAFADSTMQAINMLNSQAAIIRSISFPKAILPLSVVLSNTYFMIIGLSVAVVLACVFGPEYGTWPSWRYVFLPVVIACQMLFTFGMALAMAASGVLFKDTSNIMGHVVRMWYFMSPGLYSIDNIPDRYHWLFRLNPFTELMTAYRDILMFGRVPSLFDLGYAFFAGLAACLVGFLIFRGLEGRLVQNL